MAAIDKNSMAASDKNNQNFNKNDKMHMKVIVNLKNVKVVCWY